MGNTPLNLEIGASTKKLEDALERIAKQLDALVVKSQRFAETLQGGIQTAGAAAQRALTSLQAIGRAAGGGRGAGPASTAFQDAAGMQRLARQQAEAAKRLAQEVAAAEKSIAQKAIAEREASVRAASKTLVDIKVQEAQAIVRAQQQVARDTSRTLPGTNVGAALARDAAAAAKKQAQEAEELGRKLAAAQQKANRFLKQEQDKRDKEAAAAQRKADQEIARQRAAAQRNAERLHREHLSRLERASLQVQNRIESFSNRILFSTIGLARQVGSRIVSVLTGGGLEALFTRAADFEKTLADVGSLLSKGAPSLDAYRSQLQAIAQTTSKSLVDLTRGLYEAISAGADPALRAGGALDIVNQAQRAAVAGLADTIDAVKAGTIVFNTFGRQVGSAETVFNKLFEAVNIGVFTFPELANAIGRVSNIAASSGVSFDTMLGGLASISKGGVSAAESVTQLSRLIVAITNPTQSAAKAARQFGIEISASRLKRDGLQAIIRDLDRLVSEKGVEALRAVVGGRIEAFRAALSLIREGGREFENDTKRIRTGVDALDRAFALQSQKIGFQVGVLRNQFDVLASEVFKEVEPVLVGLVKDLGRQFQNLDRSGIKQFFVDLAKGLREFVNSLVSARDTVVSFVKAVASFARDTVIVAGVLALSRAVTAVRASFVGAADGLGIFNTRLGELRALGAGGAAKALGSGFAQMAATNFAGLATGIFLVVEALRAAVVAAEALGTAAGEAFVRLKELGEAPAERTAALIDSVAGGVDRTALAIKKETAFIREQALDALQFANKITEARRDELRQRVVDLEESVKEQEQVVATARQADRDNAKAVLDEKRRELAIVRGILTSGKEAREEDLLDIEAAARVRKLVADADVKNRQAEYDKLLAQRRELLQQFGLTEEVINAIAATGGIGKALGIGDLPEQLKAVERVLAPFNTQIENVKKTLEEARARQQALGRIQPLAIARGAVEGQLAGAGAPTAPKAPGAGRRGREVLLDERAALREEVQLQQARLRLVEEAFRNEEIARTEFSQRALEISRELRDKQLALSDEEARFRVEKLLKIAESDKESAKNRERAAKQISVLLRASETERETITKEAERRVSDIRDKALDASLKLEEKAFNERIERYREINRVVEESAKIQAQLLDEASRQVREENTRRIESNTSLIDALFGGGVFDLVITKIRQVQKAAEDAGDETTAYLLAIGANLTDLLQRGLSALADFTLGAGNVDLAGTTARGGIRRNPQTGFLETTQSQAGAFRNSATDQLDKLNEFFTKLALGADIFVKALADRLPLLIPAFGRAAIALVRAIVQQLPAITDAIIASLPQLFEMIASMLPDIVNQLIAFAIQKLPELATAAVVMFIAKFFESDFLGRLVVGIVEGIANGISGLVSGGFGFGDLIGLDQGGVLNRGGQIRSKIQSYAGGGFVDAVNAGITNMRDRTTGLPGKLAVLHPGERVMTAQSNAEMEGMIKLLMQRGLAPPVAQFVLNGGGRFDALLQKVVGMAAVADARSQGSRVLNSRQLADGPDTIANYPGLAPLINRSA